MTLVLVNIFKLIFYKQFDEACGINKLPSETTDQRDARLEIDRQLHARYG